MEKQYSQRVDTLIIGASAFGCAYAVAHKDDVIILESSLVLCSEFCSAYRCTPIPMNLPLSALGKNLKTEMQARNLLDETGAVSIPPVSGLVGKQLLDSGVSLMLMCSITTINRSEDGFQVCFYGPDGFGKIYCSRILDTTSRGCCHEIAEEYSASKSLCAMLSHSENPYDIRNFKNGNISVRKGRFSEEYILCLSLDLDDDWISARRKLTCFWESHYQQEFSGWQIGSISAFFDYEYPFPIQKKFSDNHFWIPSASYPNIIEALEGGTACVIAV